MNIQLRLDKMIYGDRVLGRHNGRVVFVNPGGIEEELVDIQIVEEKKDYLVGNILKIREASPLRIAPVCKYFQLCGGCQWQHIDYSAQLRFKEQIIQEQLARIGKIEQPHVLPVIGMENPWEYRSRSRFVLKTMPKDFSLGFYQAKTRDIVDVDYCRLMSKEMNEGYAAIRDVITARIGKFQAHCAVEIKSFEDGIIVFFITSPGFQLNLDDLSTELSRLPVIKGVHQLAINENHHHGYCPAPALKTYFGQSVLTHSIEGLTFRVQPGSFFQVNLSQAQRLFSEAIRLLLTQENHSILDGHCGVGVLSLLAARQIPLSVIGVDTSASSICDARENARINNIKNTHFLQDTLGKAIDKINAPGNGFDAVILNPPRDGIVEKHVLQWLLETKPARIVYVSCNPTTLARDIRVLVSCGGYSLVLVQPVDMFPQTYHVESIALLVR